VTHASVRAVIVGLLANLLFLPASLGRVSAQELFPRFDFHLDAEYVTSDDPRFNWIFDFGGDIDIVRTSSTRAVFETEFEAIAGEQFRRFDVNQGNYLIEGGWLFRVRGVEVGPIWHHVSRHLSDRAKRFPVDWNMLALRVRGDMEKGAIRGMWLADARFTITNAFVDYDWDFEGRTDLLYRLTPRWSMVGKGSLRVAGVDGSRGRGTQIGGRGEVGIRLDGTRAAAEVFAGAERRIDPYPIEFGTASWFLAGLRLLSR
jgi:hypothetical protein